MKPWNLKYFESGEWQVVEEKLRDKPFCPCKTNLFRALRITPEDKVKVVFLGQDPYPNPKDATGLAFSSPNITGTLKNIFTEYVADLHYDYPTTGILDSWATQGVLLWNVYPSCFYYRSLSNNYEEYLYLTKEIVERLVDRSIIFVSFGSIPKNILKNILKNKEEVVINLAHPSPRNISKNNSIVGSRIFTRINDILVSKGKEPINWRL